MSFRALLRSNDNYIFGTFLIISVKDSPYMQYFINMAGAEEELYKKWKEITLNSTGSDQVRICLMLSNYGIKI